MEVMSLEMWQASLRDAFGWGAWVRGLKPTATGKPRSARFQRAPFAARSGQRALPTERRTRAASRPYRRVGHPAYNAATWFYGAPGTARLTCSRFAVSGG
jgi:hypothetical protein